MTVDMGAIDRVARFSRRKRALEQKVLPMGLPVTELAPYMLVMRTHGRGLLHTAIAVVFGFMSLVHGPVMTFAKGVSGPAHHLMNADGPHHGISHDHRTAPVDSPLPAEPVSAPVCYAFGCFIGLDAVAPGAPAASLNRIGTLLPAPAPALLAGVIAPPVPPPRLPA